MNTINFDEYTFWYINREVAGFYVGLNEELDPESNIIVDTYEKYINDDPSPWFKLSEGQIDFKKNNPNASIKEVIDMKLTPIPEPTPEEVLRQAKVDKVNEIDKYGFKQYYIDGNNVWTENRIYIKDACGRKEQVELYGVTYPSAVMEYIMDDMSSYNDICEDRVHLLTNQVKNSETVEEVEAIEVNGFPKIINTTQDVIAAKVEAKNSGSIETQAVSFSRMMINTPTMAAYISPNDALSVQQLYPIWGEQYAELGKIVSIGFRFNYRPSKDVEYTLYEVIQEHALSENWKPDTGTESLYKVVQEEHAGTLEDPIPWKLNMVLENGLYYTDKGVLYKCIRDSGQGMSFDLADLVSGGYVEVVE